MTGASSAAVPAGATGILGVLVLYRPGADFGAVLARTLAELPAVYLWDNTESGDPSPVSEVLAACGTSDRARIEYVRSSHNVGLPIAYNRAVQHARDRGDEFVLFLDQDSLIEPGTAARLRSTLTALPDSLRPGALNARNLERVVVGLSPKTALSKLWDSGYEQGYRTGRLYRAGAIRERWTLTNSGLFARAATLAAVGGFNEELFLDAVDYAMAAQLRAAGYRLFEDTGARIDHRQGSPARWEAAGRSWTIRTYDARRSFHLVRDTTVAAARMWARDPVLATAISTSMWIGTAGAVALLPERGSRIRMILQGLSGSLRRSPPTPPNGSPPTTPSGPDGPSR
ncbi:MAG TPA: glycosyltransferase [Thermoplasmata archaeon]|nr:glycosyltransferase [Thermoplasmata archaeon]